MAGIECEFVEKPPKAVQCECPICLLILRQPYQATCCGKSFCKKCIERVKVGSSRCPVCKTENFFSYPNKGLEQPLYDFEVYCSHKSKGCEWRGELRELDKHLNSEPPADKSLEGCSFTVIRCPFSHSGCDVKLPRKDIKIHVDNDLLSHLMKQVGLVTTLKQDNITLRETNQYLEQRVTKLEEEMKQLKEVHHVGVHICPQDPIGRVELTITNFSQYQENEGWYSPPFYTHSQGYKMCLCVMPKGWGIGQGTHLSVLIYMMRGEFDEQLKWPFRGDITYQLIDLEESKDHVAEVIHFNDYTPSQSAKRVTEGEENSNGWGHSQVFPLSRLAGKYLMNDCIKIHITKLVVTA